MIKENIFTFLKGIAMGTANVIPGVSGGTIALITGVFERLINSIKSFDLKAIKLLLKGRFKEFCEHTDFIFLISLILGIAVAIISLARILDYLFIQHPVYVWAFFFGLVLSSVWFVGKTSGKWNVASVISFLTGCIIAIGISLLSPATENANIWYLILCGIIGFCSMILPGLSGSFVLLLMGNYQLVMIYAVKNFKLDILIPVIVGGVIGLIVFSRFLSWLLEKYRQTATALLTGFIFGSLGIIWPWKHEITTSFNDKTKVIGYQWYLPAIDNIFFWAVLFFLLGIAVILITETLAGKKEN